MKAKYTKGPWIGYYSRLTNSYTAIKPIEYENKQYFPDSEECEANLKLILVAPEMLEMLEDAVNFIDLDTQGREFQQEIKNLIKKAKGEI